MTGDEILSWCDPWTVEKWLMEDHEQQHPIVNAVKPQRCIKQQQLLLVHHCQPVLRTQDPTIPRSSPAPLYCSTCPTNNNSSLLTRLSVYATFTMRSALCIKGIQ